MAAAATASFLPSAPPPTLSLISPPSVSLPLSRSISPFLRLFCSLIGHLKAPPSLSLLATTTLLSPFPSTRKAFSFTASLSIQLFLQPPTFLPPPSPPEVVAKKGEGGGNVVSPLDPAPPSSPESQCCEGGRRSPERERKVHWPYPSFPPKKVTCL